MARAIIIRCFSPPLTPYPSAPIRVFIPSGRLSIYSVRQAISRALSSLSLSYSSPNIILFLIVSENMKFSCITMPEAFLMESALQTLMSSPPTVICPPTGLQNFSSSFISVVFPLPLSPTIAVILPAGIFTLTSYRAAFPVLPVYLNVRCSISISIGRSEGRTAKSSVSSFLQRQTSSERSRLIFAS